MKIVQKIKIKLKVMFIDFLESVFSNFPLKEKTIYFLSFEGDYSDSPRYLSEEIHRQNGEVRHVWSLNRISSSNQRPSYIKQVKHNSIKDIYFRCCSKVVVDNVIGLNSRYIYNKDNHIKISKKIHSKKKKNQYSVSTWHGTPLKRMVKDEPGSKVVGFETTLDEMFWSDDHTIEILKSVLYNKVKLLKLGSPRNDILVNLTEEKVIEIKAKLNLSKDNKILLFAPTFRKNDVYNSGLIQLKNIDFNLLTSVLSDKFGGIWTIVTRFHYHVDNQIKWKSLTEKYDGKIINGNLYEDMAEYLAVADILVTDYSSSMFDFSITNRPVFLYCHDIEHYENIERGFYLDIRNLPFAFAYDINMLLMNIRNFDDVEYRNKLERMNSELGSINDGKSSKRISKRILTHI